jgi:P4 family phage/plasmid primase-like protien
MQFENELLRVIDVIKTSTEVEGIKNVAGDIFPLEWASNTHCNCLACGSKDNFSFRNDVGKCLGKCHGCETGGDIITLVKKFNGLSTVEAVKFLADYFNIEHNLNKDDTTVISQEEIDENKRKFEALQKEREAKKAKEQEIQKSAQAKAREKMYADAKGQRTNLIENFSIHADKIKAIIPYYNNATFQDHGMRYLGYDSFHDSLTIINTFNDEVSNIKHRQKWLWDSDKKAYDTTTRNDGKWISTFNATLEPFPMLYFKRHEDSRVILCEGEKDALNMLSLDINCLTLGGVSNSWEPHKELLKDKTVYIFFDNDDAGYTNAIKKYNEIKDICNVYVVLFFDTNATNEKGYDISDFIVEMDIKDKDDFFHEIAYATYQLSNQVIKRIERHQDLDLSSYYIQQKTKSFQDIKREWTKKDKDGNYINIITPRGEKDIKGYESFYQSFKETKKQRNLTNEIKETLVLKLNPNNDTEEKKIEDSVSIIDQMMKNYDVLHKQYSQQHLTDMAISFMMMAKKTNNTFAKYRGYRWVWTGTHYAKLREKEDNLDGFLLTKWMPGANIDTKKRSPENVEKIIKHLDMASHSIDEIRDIEYQNDNFKNIISFKNGTLIMKTSGDYIFKNIHDKKDASTNYLDFDFEENATCPKWDKFLKKVLPDEKDRLTIMEFIGYCFVKTKKYEKFLFMYGKNGANGKSVIIGLIKKLIGEDNYSSLNLQDMVGHPLIAVVNKMVNLGTEVDAKNLKDDQFAKLKSFTGGTDSVSIDPKYDREQITLRPHEQPKFIFNGNNQPKAYDMDDGVLRRMLFVDFKYSIAEKERITDLVDRFSDELGGILIQSIRAFQGVAKRNAFTQSDTMIEHLKEYKEQSDPIRMFINTCIEKDNECMVSKDLIYHFYVEFSKEMGNSPLKYGNFFRKLKEEMPNIQDMTQVRIHIPGIDNVKPRCIKGAFCMSSDIATFKFGEKTWNTRDINYDIDTKQIILKEEI